MPNPHDDPAALKALQDDIYHERVLRARGLTVEQRLAEMFELSIRQFDEMLAGAMHQLGTTNEKEAWDEIRRYIFELDQLRDAGFYVAKSQ